jgi:Fic family protein
VDLETKAVLKQCITARAALAELKQAAQLIPNQAMLINTLPLLEARASSEIENIVTTADELFRFAGSEHGATDPATREALRYRAALYAGYQSLRERPLSTVTAVEICQTIKDRQIDIRRVPGTALANQRSGQVIYTPPEGADLLRSQLANWEQFLHNETALDPLVRMAVGHYQFEAIHPFADGNGRTGRILNIIRQKAEYYGLLLQVTRDQAWEPWLLYMLEAVEETSRWTLAKIVAIRALAEHTAEFVRRTLPKIYSRELVDLIFAQPYCRIANLDAAGIAKRQTASKYLLELVGAGVLTEQAAGKEKLFVHPKLMNVLTNDGNDWEPYSLTP